MEKLSLKEIEGVDITKAKSFPFSGLKTIGCLHIGLGVICASLGIINIITFVILFDVPTSSNSQLKKYQELASNFAITSTGIWCGVWFCMCGGMAVNISEQNRTSIYCMKISFLTLSILCAALFGPACFCVNGYEAFVRHELYNDYKWMVPMLTAFFAFNEIVLSVISAGICCCCSPIKQSKVKVFLATENTIVTVKKKENNIDNQDSRPINPHLQKNVNENIENIETNQLARTTDKQPTFKTSSRNNTSRYFTAVHLNYRKDDIT